MFIFVWKSLLNVKHCTTEFQSIQQFWLQLDIVSKEKKEIKNADARVSPQIPETFFFGLCTVYWKWSCWRYKSALEKNTFVWDACSYFKNSKIIANNVTLLSDLYDSWLGLGLESDSSHFFGDSDSDLSHHVQWLRLGLNPSDSDSWLGLDVCNSDSSAKWPIFTILKHWQNKEYSCNIVF